MAGALRHMIQRGDAFWARIIVPKELRQIIGKTELRVPLGSNRKLAERDLHAAVAAIQVQLAAAQAKLDVSASPPVPMRARPLTVPQIAHTHFAEELALDATERDHPNQDDVPDMAWAREGYATCCAGLLPAGRATTRRAPR